MRPSPRTIRLATWLTLFLAVPAEALGQSSPANAQGPPRTAAALSPDTVQVGTPFTLGVSIAGPETASAEFPSLVTLVPELEQLRTVDTEWVPAGGGSWRARYRLVAWKAGTWTIPPVEVGWEGGTVSVAPPSVHVTSVLPAASEGPLPLEGPRGPRSTWRFPWWLLLLLLLALAALRWLAKRLRSGEEAEEPAWIDPAEQAREGLARLKRELERGELDLAAFYDGLESVLRAYLAARRGWPPQRPVREFVDEAGGEDRTSRVEEGLHSLQGRAGLVRFAHVSAAEAVALKDADACLAWVEAEAAAEAA